MAIRRNMRNTTSISFRLSEDDLEVVRKYIKKHNLRGSNGHLLSMASVGENLFRDFVEFCKGEDK